MSMRIRTNFSGQLLLALSKKEKALEDLLFKIMKCLPEIKLNSKGTLNKLTTLLDVLKGDSYCAILWLLV